MEKASHEITVHWTGEYPTKCAGRWELTIDGKSIKIPAAFVSKSMNTYGEFRRVDSDEWNGSYIYSDGLLYGQWITENRVWINRMLDYNEIKFNDGDYWLLWLGFNNEDWRYLSCGGCL